MKKIALAVLFGCTGLFGFSQASTKGDKRMNDFPGIYAGANYWEYHGSDANGAKWKFGWQAGVLYNLPLAHSLTIQPEVNIAQVGAKGDVTYQGTTTTLKDNLTYLNVLATFQLHVMPQQESHLYFELGPQLGFLLSAKQKDGSSTDIKSSLKSTDFGINGGVGYQLSEHLRMDVRYFEGLSKISKAGDLMDNGFSFTTFPLTEKNKRL